MSERKLYKQVYVDVLAESTLSDAAFRLLCFMASNKKGWELSTRQVCDHLGWGVRKYEDARAELYRTEWLERQRRGNRWSKGKLAYDRAIWSRQRVDSEHVDSEHVGFEHVEKQRVEKVGDYTRESNTTIESDTRESDTRESDTSSYIANSSILNASIDDLESRPDKCSDDHSAIGTADSNAAEPAEPDETLAPETLIDPDDPWGGTGFIS